MRLHAAVATADAHLNVLLQPAYAPGSDEGGPSWSRRKSAAARCASSQPRRAAFGEVTWRCGRKAVHPAGELPLIKVCFDLCPSAGHGLIRVLHSYLQSSLPLPPHGPPEPDEQQRHSVAAGEETRGMQDKVTDPTEMNARLAELDKAHAASSIEPQSSGSTTARVRGRDAR